MLLDKSLSIALLISAIFHLLVFLPLSLFKNLPVQKRASVLKITYLAPQKPSPPKPVIKQRPVQVVKQEPEPQQDPAEDKPQPLAAEKKVIPPKPQSQYAKIEIPPELPKEKEALYLDYYQSIRDKIRLFVLENYPRFIDCGEVCLYFVLYSNGGLKEVNVIAERSSPNRPLIEIAKKSLRDAAPFSAFPKELNQPQLAFNVIISFELED